MTQREQAEGIVKTNVLWSMGAGVIPIPFVDSAAVLVVQLDMLRQLSAFYGHDFSETSGRSWISALTAGYATRVGAQFLAQGLKMIPVIGSVIGGASMAAIAGAMTYAIGMVFIQHFESGGNLFDFDASKVKDFYNEQFEKGKKVAQDMKDKYDKRNDDDDEKASSTKGEPKSDTESAGKEGNPLEKLKELKKLHEEGILSEEEFQKMKEKILDQI
jgi:uncharacterized protein (DUF697 family)